MPPVDPDRPDVPDRLRKTTPPEAAEPDPVEVGEFRQGNPFSRLSLGTYLVGRAMVESLGNALYLAAVIMLGLAAVAEWLVHSTALAVLLVVVAGFVLLARWVLVSLIRRVTGFGAYGPIEERIGALAHDTRSDVMRELRRVGLPGRVWSLPLLPLRLVSPRRRGETMKRLRQFQVANAVPKARIDEFHLLLRQAFDGGVPPQPPQ